MRPLAKRSFSIVLILFLVHILITTFNSIKTWESTTIHISIQNNLDVTDIKDLIVDVTQYNPKKINVELDKTNANEVTIRTNLMDENAYEKLILKLRENYGDGIEVLMLTNVSTTDDSKNRQIVLITLSIALIVTISTLLIRDELKRRRIG